MTWGFDMTSAYEDLLSFMLMSLFLITNGHVFQSVNVHKGIGVRPASTDVVDKQHPQMCIKCKSRQLKP